MTALQKFNKGVSACLKIVLIICFIYMTVTLSIQVFGRYLFNSGFTWTEETARYIMIWAIFLGAAYIALNAEHIKVSIIEDMMKKTSQKQVMRLIQHIVSLIFVVLIVRYGFSQLAIAKLSTSANTGLSMIFPYSVFPVAGILLTYSYFYRVLETIMNMKNGKGGEVK